MAVEYLGSISGKGSTFWRGVSREKFSRILQFSLFWRGHPSPIDMQKSFVFVYFWDLDALKSFVFVYFWDLDALKPFVVVYFWELDALKSFVFVYFWDLVPKVYKNK